MLGYILEDFLDFVCEVDLVNLSTKKIVIHVELLRGILCLRWLCNHYVLGNYCNVCFVWYFSYFLAIPLKFYTKTNNGLRR